MCSRWTFKLVLVFCVIIGVMWMKSYVDGCDRGICCNNLLYGLSPDVAVHGIIKGATARATVETLVVFYSITFLQRMMEKRKNLSNAQVAMNGLFNNNRVNASIVPFLLGMLPAASTVLICGPIVRESVKDSDLSVPEQACITSYFRHISEAFVPTYTSIFIALGITEGRVSAGTFILAMLPMVAALFAVAGSLSYAGCLRIQEWCRISQKGITGSFWYRVSGPLH